MSLEVGLLIAAVVLLGNAFFVGAEFAIVSARRSSIELKAVEGSRAAKLTLSAMEQVSLMLAGAQLGITVCSLIFGAVGEPVVAHALEQPLHAVGVPDWWLHPIAFTIALTLMVYLHVVIGEMVPKNISLARSTGAALILAPPLWFIVKAIRPLVVGLNAIANACLRLVGVNPRKEIRSSFTRDEVAGFVKESHREGLLSSEEEHLLSGALQFEERQVKQLALALDDVITATSRPTPREVEALSAKTGFSRFPVPRKGGGLKGYVHVKDMLQIDLADQDTPIPARYIRKLEAVKSNTSLRNTLAIMRESGSHMVQVTDTRNSLVGIAMLQDVLEELVGPIDDNDQATTAP